MDVVSDVITVLRTGRPSSNRTSVDVRWQVPFEAYDGAGFHILLRGNCSLLGDFTEPVRLGVGDVVLLPHGSAHRLAGDGTEPLCGRATKPSCCAASTGSIGRDPTRCWPTCPR